MVASRLVTPAQVKLAGFRNFGVFFRRSLLLRTRKPQASGDIAHDFLLEFENFCLAAVVTIAENLRGVRNIYQINLNV